MISILRVAAAVNRVVPADSAACLEGMRGGMQALEAQSPDILLFPSLSLSGVCCGSLFSGGTLLERCRAALEQLAALSAQYPGYLVAGLPMEGANGSTSVMAVLRGGAVCGLLPALDAPAPLTANDNSPGLLPADTVFGCGGLRFAVLACDAENLPRYIHRAAHTGCDLVLCASAQPATAGSMARGLAAAQAVSRDWGIAVAVAAAGVGEVSSPFIYRGWCGIWECGQQAAFSVSNGDPVAVVCDLDGDVIRALKKTRGGTPPLLTCPAVVRNTLLRRISPDPFGQGMGEPELLELFELQARSLAGRLQSSHQQKLILGVSGGLDSTLALLVCVRALAMLGRPVQSLIGVTMPGPGTSGRTKSNAVALLEAVGADLREIPIGPACAQHYHDIGLDEQDRSVAYENAQARERTQILMDIGNLESALVVGTGDMSEAALGWCTFGGDHLAGYGVNACLTKGLVRRVCAAAAGQTGWSDGLAALLDDVLDTPVSPELLPPDQDGSISQQTEEILGSYELHDFFLYYWIRYGMRPDKIYRYACVAFAGRYAPEVVKDRLRFFFKRFFASQFKRTCQTDSAAILLPNLGPMGFSFPADLAVNGLLEELERA